MMVSSVGGDSYYQLDMAYGATVHKLGGKRGGGGTKESHPHEDDVGGGEVDDNGDIDAKVPTRDPFKDVGRFGPERRVVFHEDSLGVKLHRSPTEGIVRVLCLLATSTSTSNSLREGVIDDDDSKGEDVEPGDVILEVGGVDLRHKHIGAEEWADMVHFVKHVGRPLEMVVARDKTFVAPTTTTTTTAMTTGTGTTNNAATVDDVDAREEKEEMEMEMEETEHENGGGIFDNVVCFSIRADEICNLPRVDEVCNLPCPGTTDGGGVIVCGIEITNRPPLTTSPMAATANSSSATTRKVHPWDASRRGGGEEDEDGKDDDDDDSVYAASVAVGGGEPRRMSSSRTWPRRRTRLLQ
jgi:hypothetical protein